MESFVAEKLPDDIVSGIRTFIAEKMSELERKGLFYNKMIREDILPLLDDECTVIYYPKEDRENNGFHKTYRFHGEDVNFVYINTNQDIEKQIFTAAHELGHVWKVDVYLKERLGIEIDFDLDERIMNRFAAELLMPEELFSRIFYKSLDEKRREDGGLTVENLIQVITTIMNEFYVPYKSVVYRLYELDYISKNSASVLWNGTSSLPKALLISYSKEYAQKQGFFRLYAPDRKKYIAGLKDALDDARKKSKASEQWLREFYARFELKPSDAETSLKEEITVEKSEETRDNAGESSN